jgi:hypothetical protein
MLLPIWVQRRNGEESSPETVRRLIKVIAEKACPFYFWAGFFIHEHLEKYHPQTYLSFFTISGTQSHFSIHSLKTVQHFMNENNHRTLPH